MSKQTIPRVDRTAYLNIPKSDLSTINDIYHVSEFCAEIEHHMQTTEHETQPDPLYMKR